MEITITIDTCDDHDTPEVLFQHLDAIKEQVTEAFKPKNKHKIKHTSGGDKIYLEDNNCYGTHEVEIIMQ